MPERQVEPPASAGGCGGSRRGTAGGFGGTKPHVGTHGAGGGRWEHPRLGRAGVVQPARPLRRRCGEMRELPGRSGCTKLLGLQPFKMLLGRFEGSCALPGNKSPFFPHVSYAHVLLRSRATRGS